MTIHPELHMPMDNAPQGSGAEPNIRSWRRKEAWEIQREREKVEGDIADEISDLEKEIARLSAIEMPSLQESERLAAVKNERERLQRPMAVFVYGGRLGWNIQKDLGDWQRDWQKTGIPEGVFQDQYGLSDNKMSFGVGTLANKTFLFIKLLQNDASNRKYRYSLLIDPGEVIWRMAKWNGAAIISKILDDPLYQELLNNPKISVKEMVERLKNQDLAVEPEVNAKVRNLFIGAGKKEGVVVAGKGLIEEKPTPQQWAGYMASVPVDQRKNTTFLIGGWEGHGKVLGAKVVWDPNK